MAKELIYKVRIDFDTASSKQFGSSVERSAEQAEKSINDATQAQNRFNEAQESASRSSARFRKTQSSANQVLFSYGDLLNDAQQFQFGFSNGLRAIGNNIGFAAEGIANLNNRAGGFTGTLKALGSSLLGPGGIILGLNLAVTAVTVFGDSMFGAKEKTEDLNVELKETSSFLKDIATNRVDEFAKSFEDLSAKEGALNTALDSLQDQARVIDQQIEGFQKLTQNANIYNSLSDEQRQIAAGQLTQLIQQREETGEINSLAQDLLKNKLAEIEAQRLVNRALGDTLQTQKEVNAEQEKFILGRGVGFEAVQLTAEDFLDLGRTETAIGEFQSSVLGTAQNVANQRVQINKEAQQKITAIEEINARQRGELQRQAISQSINALSAAFNQFKPLAVATAIIDGILAVQKVLANVPPPFNFVAAGAMAAATAKNVQKIIATEPGGGGGSASTGGGNQGFNGGNISRGQSARNRPSLRGIGSESKQSIMVNVKADRKGFSAWIEEGKRERKATSFTLRSDI